MPNVEGRMTRLPPALVAAAVAAERPCPCRCHKPPEKRNKGVISDMHLSTTCQPCKGTNVVPLLPGARKPCPGPNSFYAEAATGHGIAKVGIIGCSGEKCLVCDGKGWTPATDAEVLVACMRWWAKEEPSGRIMGLFVTLSCKVDGEYPVAELGEWLLEHTLRAAGVT